MDNNKNKKKMREDLVQCVPTRKGHHILFKGYTYTFKSRLQCGAEQWCCSYRQKTGCISMINMQAYGVEVLRDFHNHKKPMFSDDVLPEWVSIYYLKISENEQKCNVCEAIIEVDDKSFKLFHHIKDNHKEVHDIHKNGTEGAVGFQIEFLHLLKDDDPKSQPMVLGQVCETMISENKTEVKNVEENEDLQFVLIPTKKKANKKGTNRMIHEHRRRSWVWKYFKKLSNIIYRCTLCDVVLSIKACNTNNMNRHVRARHPNIYKTEVGVKIDSDSDITTEVDIPVSQSSPQIKEEDPSVIVEETDMDDAYYEALGQKQRRSWVWSYFTRVSKTLAQCKLCNRNICHGGNATGNMNRHLKMVHHKTGEDNSWVWKVFDSIEDDFYSCKICQYKCMKFEDMERSVNCILEHLKIEHGVVSGDQIVIDSDF